MFIYCYVWILQGFYWLHGVEICLKQVSRVWNQFLKQVSWVSCHEFEVSLNKFQICLQISTYRRFVFSSWHLKEESPLDFIKNILHILYDCTYNAMESVSKYWDILNPESGSEVWTSGLCNLKTEICTSISLRFLSLPIQWRKKILKNHQNTFGFPLINYTIWLWK